jgi:hypothetical protein
MAESFIPNVYGVD